MKKKVTGIVLALSIALGGAHTAGAAESTMEATEEIGANVEETTITTEGDVTTISGPDGVTTLTEDAAANTITINSPNGVTVLNRNEVLGFEEQGGHGSVAETRARGIVTDWRVYLCNAATAAVVGGHEATWAKALKVAKNVAKLHPATRIALAAGHLGAGTFLSTQC